MLELRVVGMRARVLLRNTQTRRYYAGRDHWVNEQSGALDFESLENAGQRVYEEHLSQTEVVLHFEDPECELAMPIRAE